MAPVWELGPGLCFYSIRIRGNDGAHYCAARFLAGAAGASLALYGGKRRDALGAGLGAAGLALLTRGITNTGLKSLTGIGSDDGQQRQLTTGH